MAANVLVVFLNCLALYTLVLAAHALRTRFSLAPCHILLGFLAASMMWVSELGLRAEFGKITVYWGSAMFAGILLVVFVMYVFDGSAAARFALITVCGATLLTYVVMKSLHWQVMAGYAKIAVPVPEPSLRNFLASSGAALLDFLLLAIVWESLQRALRGRFLVGCIFVTLLSALWLDAVVYVTAALGNHPAYWNILEGNVLTRLLLCAGVAPILSAYVWWQQRVHGVDLARGHVLAILQRSSRAERELSLAQREIERRKKAEAELRESEAQYRTLVQNIPGVTFRCRLDEARTMLYASDAMEELTGYTPREFVKEGGRSFGELIHPEDRALVARAIEEGIRADGEYSAGYRILHRSGETRWVGEKGKVLAADEDGAQLIDGVMSDVTERKLAEAQIREREEQIRNLLDASPVAMLVMDQAGRTVSMNQKFVEIFGYDAESVPTAEHWWPLAYPDPAYRAEVRTAWDACIGDAIARGSDAGPFEANVTCRDGRVRRIEFRMSGIGRLMLNVLTDLTEQKAVEQALREAKEEAEAATNAKSAFLANMSHEIRTPMNAILGFSQLLKRDPDLSAEQRDHIETINRSGEHLLSLINDILEMSKIEAGRTTVNVQTVNLCGMLDDLERMFRVRTDAKGLRLTFERDRTAPRHVVTDESKLRQILINLIGNAVKFTQAGGVTVRTSAAPAGSGRVRLTMAVEDTGPGMSAEEVEGLFQAFHQTRSGTRTSGGTGLGLAISREFARLLGGGIEVRSIEGAGTEFRCTIEAGISAEEAASVRTEERRVVGIRGTRARPRVLVVDDHEINRDLLARFLTPVGFEVSEACDGEEAIQSFEQRSPDLVLMDVAMPRMDGREATRRIKATERGRSTPIIVVTASAFEEERATVLALGADDFVRKPFVEHELFEKIGARLGIEYEYEDEHGSVAAGAGSPLTRGSVAHLPEPVGRRVLEAVNVGDVDALARAIDAIAELEPALGARLREAADRFEFDLLLELFQPGGPAR